MMIRYTQGNLLDADTQALVNTVNTVGVMGKGIALMFKEAFPETFKAYEAACRRKDVKLGRMVVTERNELLGPKWIINFPTKGHWRYPSKISWIEEGLQDLRRVIEDKKIRSIALPPLGSGQGGLDWQDVRARIEQALANIPDVEIVVYEPTERYQNVSKRQGVEKLTPARALIAELVRRYWILGIECSLLEIQKLAWFLERSIETLNLKNPLNLRFKADRYGPYADPLRHLLNSLDGSYLNCDKRINDAGPFEIIRFNDAKKDKIAAYLRTGEAKEFQAALELADTIIDGFQSPLGMELLATVDWLIQKEGAEPSIDGIKKGLCEWPAGKEAIDRKLNLFDDRLIELALGRLKSVPDVIT